MKLRYFSILPVLMFMGQMPAIADDDVLSVTPLTHVKDGYFEATAEPGETVDFTLRITTTGESQLTSRVASAVPRLNGGFAAGPDALTPSASWFSYEPQSFTLAGEREETYSVTVPTDTPAGEYASGVVVETQYKDAGKGISHRYQQTVPVNIVVDGEQAPDFAFGSASHSFKAGKSAVAFEVVNEGDRHVSPAGTAEIHDAKGKTVSTADLKMASVYTGTTAEAEIILADALLPGDYTVLPDFTDQKSDASATAEIPFTVEGTPETGDEKNLIEVTQEAGGGWLLPVIAVLLVAVLLTLILLLRKRNKQ